jgi:hypothetical protein
LQPRARWATWAAGVYQVEPENVQLRGPENWAPKLGETGNIQFRTEFFNLFNHANFDSPSLLAFAGLADGEAPLTSFGLIRSTITSSRQIQFGLRVSF